MLDAHEVRPFTDKQIELVTTFADQAVIAIENVRLFDEVQARTRELSESLEQQTATSEVLQRHLELARRTGACVPGHAGERDSHLRGQFRHPVLREETRAGSLRCTDAPPAFAELLATRPADPAEPANRPRPRGADPAAGSHRRRHGRPAYLEGDRASRPRRVGRRSDHLIMPMLKEGELIGAFAIYRQEVRPFTDKHIELVTNFANQAVIAIENTRLLNELRAAHRHLATSQQLQRARRRAQAISSTFDLQTVLQTLVARRRASATPTRRIIIPAKRRHFYLRRPTVSRGNSALRQDMRRCSRSAAR